MEDSDIDLRAKAREEYERDLQSLYAKYEPIGKFEEFTNLAMSGDNKINLLEAANGVGKTFGMANLLANLFWPIGNEHFQQKLFSEWPYAKKGRIVSYSNTVTETLIPTLKAVFPKDRYDIAKYSTTKAGKRYEQYWKTDTGWEFTIMTYDQDVKEFESANLGWFWEDEPPSYQIHQANYARLRMGGIGFMTETPLGGSQWIYDSFVDKTSTDLKKEGKSYIQAALEDACITHGVNGFLKHEDIEKQIAGYDPDELDARVYGKHHHLTGRVFKKWDKPIHIVRPFNITYEDFCVVEALDPHPRTPDAVMWVAIDRLQRQFICEELWGTYETSELAAMIKEIEKKYRIVKRLIDPAGFIVDKHTGYQLAADLNNRYQLSFEPGSKDRMAAIQKIREAIDFNQNESGIIVPPNLYSFETNERTNWEMNRWQWQDWRGLTAQFKNPKEKPIDKDDHMIENLGRILLADVKFEEYQVPQFIPPWTQPMNPQNKSTNLDPYR